MPAPDDLQTQTPGQPLTPPAEQAAPETKPEPEYTAKHNGGGRQRIWSRTADDWFSDFVATGEGAKEVAQAEADRLNAGGAPFVKPAEQQATAAPAAAQPLTPPAEQAAQPGRPYLTEEGWVVPDLPAAARKE